MKYAILLLLIVCICGRELSSYSFEAYASEFNKNYHNDELLQRALTFQTNLNEIIAHNQKENTYKMGVNEFTDRTQEERMVLNGYKMDVSKAYRLSSNAVKYESKGLAVPVAFDWRNQKKQVLTAVKSQGKCGSCWTFAAAAVLESHWAIKTGHLEVLSEQQIASCTENPLNCGGTGGCEGGIVQLAYDSIATKGGLASEWSYPYQSGAGQDFECTYDAALTPPIATVSGHVQIEHNTYADLMEALVYNGPIAVSVDASDFHSYASGVFTGCDTANPLINHAVTLVGYGSDPEQGPYWIIRNSWGSYWGENGYIRIQRTPKNYFCGVDKTPQTGTGCDGGPTEVTVCGMCGILYDNTYPQVSVTQQIEI